MGQTDKKTLRMDLEVSFTTVNLSKVSTILFPHISPYDLCATIVDMGDTICDSFPETQPCGCPLLAGDIDLKNVELAVPDFGPILGPLMAVSISLVQP
jgi:hypothetical protein